MHENSAYQLVSSITQKKRKALSMFIARCSEFELQTVITNRILPHYIYFIFVMLSNRCVGELVYLPFNMRLL